MVPVLKLLTAMIFISSSKPILPQAFLPIWAKLETLPLADKVEERAFKRILLSGAAETEVDSQGRILITQSLKEFADIRRDAVVIGVLRHVEIWAKERWKKYRETARHSFDKAAPHLEL